MSSLGTHMKSNQKLTFLIENVWKVASRSRRFKKVREGSRRFGKIEKVRQGSRRFEKV